MLGPLMGFSECQTACDINRTLDLDNFAKKFYFFFQFPTKKISQIFVDKII